MTAAATARGMARIRGSMAALGGQGPATCGEDDPGLVRAWAEGFAANVSHGPFVCADPALFPVKRASYPWLKVERDVLELARAEKVPFAVIARALARPENALRLQAHRRGLTENPVSRPPTSSGAAGAPGIPSSPAEPGGRPGPSAGDMMGSRGASRQKSLGRR